MEGFGLPHLIILVFIILLIFGPGKLADLGSGLGKGIRNFKKAAQGDDEIDVTPEKKKAEDPNTTPKA